MTLYVPLFLSQEVSDRSQAKRWATVRPGRRQTSASASAWTSVQMAVAAILPRRATKPDGRRLVPVDLSRPQVEPGPALVTAGRPEGMALCGCPRNQRAAS